MIFHHLSHRVTISQKISNKENVTFCPETNFEYLDFLTDFTDFTDLCTFQYIGTVIEKKYIHRSVTSGRKMYNLQSKWHPVRRKQS